MTTSGRRPRRAGSFGPLRQRNFLLVWSAGLISLAGDWMLRIALPIGVLQLTGSVAATSGVVIAGALPTLLFGSLAGVFVDRWDRRRVMIVTCLLQGLAVLPLTAMRDADTVWIGYVVAFAVASLTRFFEPAEGALLPQLVGDDQLVAANALNAVNNNLARLAGPALGGLVAAWSGLTGVAVLDAATFAAAAGLLAMVGGRHAAPGVAVARTAASVRQAVGTFGREFADGIGVIRRSRVLLVLIGTFTATSVGEGVMGALFPVYVAEGLRGGVTEVGWLMSAQAVGGIAGGLAASRIGTRVPPVRLISIGMVAFGAVDIAFFGYPWLTPVLWPGLLLIALAGLPAVIGNSAATAQVQAAVADAYRGRVLAVAGTTMGIGAMAGAALAGIATDMLGVLPMLVVFQGGGLVMAGVAVALLLGRHRTGADRGDAPETPQGDRAATAAHEILPV